VFLLQHNVMNRCMFDMFTLVSVSLRHTKNEYPIRETFVWRKDTFRLWKISNMQRFNEGLKKRPRHETLF
jgi:hypothetical protein